MNRSRVPAITLRMHFAERAQKEEPELLDMLFRDTVPHLADLSRLTLRYSTDDRIGLSATYPGRGWKALIGNWHKHGVISFVAGGQPSHQAVPDHMPYKLVFGGRTRVEPYRSEACLWTGKYLELDILTGVEGWAIPDEIAGAMIPSMMFAASTMKLFQAGIRLRNWPMWDDPYATRRRGTDVDAFARSMDRIADINWLTIIHSDILLRNTEYDPIQERFELLEIPADHVLIKLAPRIGQVTEADLRDFVRLAM